MQVWPDGMAGAGVEGVPHTDFDLVVIGAGAAGLYAALFAALDGARVLLVEHTDRVGGTSALSAGTTWVPLTDPGRTVNPGDDAAAVHTYLDHAIGEHSPRRLREAFVQAGAAAVRRLQAQTEMQFRPYAKHPDYISDLPGSSLCGRALEPLPFDARTLGDAWRHVREPIPEFTVLGGMMVDRTDINHLLGATRSMASLRHALRILWRHLGDRLRYPRGMRWVMGNALIGRLLASLQRHEGVTLALKTRPVAFERAPGATGNAPLSHVVLESAGTRWTAVARGGIVLASGGFNRDPLQRERLLGPLVAQNPQWCPGAPGHTGQAQALARAVGAQHSADVDAPGPRTLSPAMWAPVSLRKRPDGSTAVFPHFVMDRAKPGVITIDRRGRRFVNESTSYHLFGLAMQRDAGQGPSVPAWLIADAQALRLYGLGMVRPGGTGLAPYLADGYLVAGKTLAELAQRIGVDGPALADTVQRFNASALAGVDADHRRGETAYQHNIGDAGRGLPNPNLGPLSEAPFYAVQLFPGDIGSADGFVTDEHARVRGRDGQVLDGLYAVGNDMRSIMGGVYPAPGITLGPALVFASLAASHALARARRA